MNNATVVSTTKLVAAIVTTAILTSFVSNVVLPKPIPEETLAYVKDIGSIVIENNKLLTDELFDIEIYKPVLSTFNDRTGTGPVVYWTLEGYGIYYVDSSRMGAIKVVGDDEVKIFNDKISGVIVFTTYKGVPINVSTIDVEILSQPQDFEMQINNLATGVYAIMIEAKHNLYEWEPVLSKAFGDSFPVSVTAKLSTQAWDGNNYELHKTAMYSFNYYYEEQLRYDDDGVSLNELNILMDQMRP